MIQKTGEGIDFDLPQTKYRHQYAAPQHSSSSNDQNITLGGKGLLSSALKSLAIGAIHWFSNSLWMPLGINEVTLNCFYRIVKHKSRAQRTT